MKKLLMILFAAFCLHSSAQTAKSVLDKTAALCSKGAVQVKFSAKAPQGNSAGTLVAQGNKFTLRSNQATIWFDGKTEWSLLGGSDEVNVSEPTPREVASMNPMNFINLYKSGYKSTLKTKGNIHEVHLTATSKSKGIKEMYVSIDKATSKPKTVKLRTGAKDWTTITVTSFTSTTKKADSFFRFNRKDHPNMQIIDLR